MCSFWEGQEDSRHERGGKLFTGKSSARALPVSVGAIQVCDRARGHLAGIENGAEQRRHLRGRGINMKARAPSTGPQGEGDGGRLGGQLGAELVSAGSVGAWICEDAGVPEVLEDGPVNEAGEGENKNKQRLREIPREVRLLGRDPGPRTPALKAIFPLTVGRVAFRITTGSASS